MIDDKIAEGSLPFFSVVVPVYNKEPHIARAINSILNQTFQDFELIIVCDPSTDNSNAEVAKFTDPRIRVFHRDEPGPGGYAARNLGIKKAKADWVAFLDADDEWYTDHLEYILIVLSEYPESKVIGAGYEMHENSLQVERLKDPYYVNRSAWGNHYLSFKEYLSAEVSGLRPICSSIACIQKEILSEAGGFPSGRANRGGDVDTWLRCVEQAGGIAWSSHIGAIYFRDSVNMVTKTQIFLAEVERETAAILLKKYDGETARLLKKFSNRRTVSAWRKNHEINEKENFFLLGKIYIKPEIKKNIFWIFISLMPKCFYKLILKNRPSIKKNILTQLKKTPLAEFAKLGRALACRLTTRVIKKGKYWKSSLTKFTHANNSTFFGYHDKTPYSLDGMKLLAMSFEANDKKPSSECSSMLLGFFSTCGGKSAQEFVVIAKTTLWCFQQGCMLQWHPINSNSEVYFNDLVDGQYSSVHFDVEQNSVIRKYPYPIYSLDPTGRYATTLNFSRLGRLRPGYGYGLLPDFTIGKQAPDDDGLFLLDLQSGEVDLVVSLAELAQSGGGPNCEHYVNHATFSTDGKRVVFFHLWSRERDPGGRGLRVCELDIHSREWRVIESERVVSHYCWRDSRSFLATTLDTSRNWQYTMYDVIDNTRTDLHLPFNEDGHPMFHPTDKNIIITDTYPDRRRDQHLCIVNLETKESFEIATLYSPMRYQGQVRCDLHPRWDREGRYVAVDSTFSGRRSLVIVDIQQ